MSIEMIKAGFEAMKPIAPLEKPKTAQVTGQVEGQGQNSFQDVFSKAINEVDDLQKSANTSIENLMLGKPGVTMHDTMVTLEKADTAFQLMNAVRSKIIRAYEEVIRTNV